MNGYKVYYHKNLINNKYYIGITKRDLYERWGTNGCNYNSQMFGYAIKKYGWNNFEHCLLFDNLSEKEAQDKEIEMIKKYNSLVPNGYNLTKGGENSPCDIVCIETYEIITFDELDNWVEKMNKNKFLGKLKKDYILDCCKCRLKCLKVPYKNEFYHFCYIKNINYDIERRYELLLNKRKNDNKEKRRYYPYKFNFRGEKRIGFTCKYCGDYHSYRIEENFIRGCCNKCDTYRKNCVTIL